MAHTAVKASDDVIATPPANGTIGHVISEIEKHAHPVGGEKLYPTGVTPVTLTSGATSDLFGDWVEIIPVDTITNKFDPHHIYFANVSDTARYYIIEVASGLAASEVIIGRIVAGAESTNKGVSQFAIFVNRVNANERLSMRVKDDEAATNTIDVAIGYHEYSTVP